MSHFQDPWSEDSERSDNHTTDSSEEHSEDHDVFHDSYNLAASLEEGTHGRRGPNVHRRRSSNISDHAPSSNGDTSSRPPSSFSTRRLSAARRESVFSQESGVSPNDAGRRPVTLTTLPPRRSSFRPSQHNSLPGNRPPVPRRASDGPEHTSLSHGESFVVPPTSYISRRASFAQSEAASSQFSPNTSRRPSVAVRQQPPSTPSFHLRLRRDSNSAPKGFASERRASSNVAPSDDGHSAPTGFTSGRRASSNIAPSDDGRRESVNWPLRPGHRLSEPGLMETTMASVSSTNLLEPDSGAGEARENRRESEAGPYDLSPRRPDDDHTATLGPEQHANRKQADFSNPFADENELVAPLRTNLAKKKPAHPRRKSSVRFDLPEKEGSQSSGGSRPAGHSRNFSRPSIAESFAWVDDAEDVPEPGDYFADPEKPANPNGFFEKQGEYVFEEKDIEWARPTLDRKRRKSSTISMESTYPTIDDPSDPAKKLSRRNLFSQRTAFIAFVMSLNIGFLMAAIFSANHTWVFVFVLMVKSKDVISSCISPIGMFCRMIKRTIRPPPEVPPQWILSLIPAYNESEEQIVKCIFSLRDNGVEPHRQVMCVILDGKPRDIKSRFTESLISFTRPYVTFKHKVGDLTVHAGFIQDVPVIVIEKKKNAGKKDSLILAHDLFNYHREGIPMYTKLLREEIEEFLLPDLTEGHKFERFDQIFCTDADSIIHKGALRSLCDELYRDPNGIAACGLVLVELEPGCEWSCWNLYQQFQYCFGQYVRRRAEHFYGKVTCLPGCITMIKVRPECAGAIAKYAEAVMVTPVVHHQVQYLGTDRRLTYSLLSQDKKLTTLFIPEAVSETVAPQSLTHYLSQRRRWGSNAYFNNYFYMAGENMILISRIAAFIEIFRLSMVYYRFANTILLWKAIIQGAINHDFNVMRLIPLLLISQWPTMWFAFSIVKEYDMRIRAHKLILGWMINKGVAPLVSMTVFWKVISNVGSQAWGISGVTQSSATAPALALAAAAVPAVPASAEVAAPAAAMIPHPQPSAREPSPDRLAEPEPQFLGEN